jgi:uncharacterized protein
MQHGRKIFLTLLSLATFTGCGRSAEQARLGLAQMNIPFNPSAFIENARQGNIDAVGLFLKAGMDPDVKINEGQTALEAATLANQVATVKHLLDNRADPNAKNRFNGTALMNATAKGHLEVVQLLLAKKADVQAQDNRGLTALMFAIWENHVEIARLLLEKGADVHTRDDNGWTALMRAAFRGHTNSVLILLEKGADVNAKSSSCASLCTGITPILPHHLS